MEPKLAKLENWRIPKLTKRERSGRREVNHKKASQDAIVKKHAILAEMEEEEQHVVCIDDVTSKDLPWHEVRKGREEELKYLRDLESMNVKPLHNTRSFQSTRSGLIQTKHLRVSPCKSDHELL